MPECSPEHNGLSGCVLVLIPAGVYDTCHTRFRSNQVPYTESSEDGVRLFYQTYSTSNRTESDAASMIFVHGAGGNAASWWQQVPHFVDRYSILTIDHRGFARSACTPAQFSAKHFSDDLLTIMDAEQIDSAILVCQSMGGWTGLTTALGYPDRVRALVMSHTPGGLTSETIREIQQMAARNRSALESPFAHWAVAPDYHEKSPEMSLLYSQISAFNTSLDLSKLDLQSIQLSADDCLGHKIPTLFVTAEQDVIFPPEMIRLASEMVPGADFIELQGAGHSSYFETAGAFNQAVDAFLDALPF